MGSYKSEIKYCWALSSKAEPPISNQEFLDSYVRYGCMIRMIAAYEQLSLLQQPNVEPARRIAAAAVTYQQFGMQVEDLACMIIALAAWAKGEELLLADILSRIALVKDRAVQVDSDYFSLKVTELATSSKRVRIDPDRFLKALLAFGGTQILAKLGLNWRRTPSVKLARGGEELRRWQLMPRAMEACLQQLTVEGSDGIGSIFNKLKHGPQLLITDILSYLRRLAPNGADAQVLDDYISAAQREKLHLRILLNGAHVARDQGSEPTNLLVSDDASAVEEVVSRLLYPPTKIIWYMVSWLRKWKFGDNWVDAPCIVHKIEEQYIRAMGRYAYLTD